MRKLHRIVVGCAFAAALLACHAWAEIVVIIIGLLTIKAAKAARPEKGGQSKLTIQYTPFGGKKQTIKLANTAMPKANEIATVKMDIPGVGTKEVLFGADSLAGVGFDLLAGKDLLKDKATKATANARLARMNGAWSFALATAEGYAAFSVTVKKGKGKLSGTLLDGTKVSVSSQGVFGDEALAIPFMYAKKGKGSLGLVFWVHDGGNEVEVSDVTEVKSASGRVSSAEIVEPSTALRLADGAHSFVVPSLNLAQAFTVAGKKWTFPKQQKKLGADDPNPYGMKLTFADKTGLVKGSFTTPTNKAKYTVNGVVVNGVMYGSAVLKGGTPVSVTAE